jgi:hypothetical protein
MHPAWRLVNNSPLRTLPSYDNVAEMKPFIRFRSFIAALLLAGWTPAARAVQERFESAEVSWRLAESDGSARLLLHERDFTVAHSGQGSEHARVWSAQATFAYLAHPVPPARIIGELVPSLWVKADRAGLRLIVRVVLPRAKDRNGRTLAVVLEGDFYTDVGTWQRLQIRNIKKLLEQEARIRRLQLGQVDPGEAYIDHVVLNAYSGPGITDVWIDDLELVGYALAERTATPVGVSTRTATTSPHPDSVGRPSRSVELRGSVFVVDDRPFFTRAIEYNGEPFAWLKEVGFNTVILPTPPTATQLSDAKEVGIWLVAPPPLANGVVNITSAHHRVIAWRLGARATAADAISIQSLAAQIRHQDREAARPIVCDIERDADRFVGIGDLLMFGKPVIGTSYDLSRYGDWMRRQLHPLSGKPVWGTVQTEPSAQLIEQLGIARAARTTNGAADFQVPKLSAGPQQIRLLAFETIAAGARGVCFRSRSRLNRDDDVSTLRAASLRLVNAELSLVEPWAAGGSFAEEITMRDRNTRGRILETNRSRLLVITHHEPNGQHVSRPQPVGSASFVAHAVPITDQAYHLSANGLQPLLRSRSTGPRILIQERDSVSLVLFTQDPLAINRSTRILSENRKRFAKLRQQIAMLQLDQTSDVVSKLNRDAPVKAALDEARATLDRAEQLMRGGDLQDAMIATRSSQQIVHRVRYDTWQEAALAFPSPTSSLLCSSFATLPLHAAAKNRLSTATWGRNILPAGDCESLGAMLRNGWRQHADDAESDRSHVELSPQEPAGGRSALRMTMRRLPEDARPPSISPISITSASVSVAAGQAIRIHGWVKVPRLIEGSDDGLMLYDSISGEQFAERITQTKSWQEFTLYRFAPRSGPLTLTFELTGFGEAWLDEISVTVLK